MKERLTRQEGSRGMKAIVYTEYGGPEVLRLEERERPAPKAKELLVRVRATTVGFGDVIARKIGNVTPGEFHMPALFWLGARVTFGWRRPKRQILGAEFAGTVAAVGRGVSHFGVGDRVFGYRGAEVGCNAEYVCIGEEGMVAPLPAGVTFPEAAVLPYGGMTALNLLKRAGLRPGKRVLVVGASGGIGSAAVQLARWHYGAEVTGVCSAAKAEFVASLGADRVLDYDREDFSDDVEAYDLVLDVLGGGSFRRARRALKADGRYMYASFKLPQLVQMAWTSLSRGRKVICALSMEKPADLLRVKELAEAGKLRPVMDRPFALEDVAEAHRHVEGGRKLGNVAVTVTG